MLKNYALDKADLYREKARQAKDKTSQSVNLNRADASLTLAKQALANIFPEAAFVWSYTKFTMNKGQYEIAPSNLVDIISDRD